MSQCNTENVPASGDPGNSRGLDDHESQAVAGTRHWAWPSLGAATLIVVLSGLVWRTVRYALAFPLWGDEAFVAVNFLTRDFAGLARPLEFFQIVPPGFLWSEWLTVRTFGASERALRLIPYLSGVASLLLFWRFCREVASRRTALLAVAILAASFYPVRHSTEVKPYSIDLLVSLMLLSAGWRAHRNIRSRSVWLTLGAVAVVGVWFSYTAVFPAVTVALFLAVTIVRERSHRLVGRWIAFAFLTSLSWLVMFVSFAGPQAHAAEFLPGLETWRNAFPPLESPLRLVWWLLEVHTGNMLAYPYGANHFGSTVTTVVVVAGCIRMARRPARRPLLWLLLGPLPVALVAAALHRYPYGTSARVMLYMAPAFCLLAGEGIMAALQLGRSTSRGPVVAGGLLAIVPLACMAFNVAMPYKAYDDVLHRSLARWVATRTKPGDQWIVFNGATPLPLINDVMVQPWLQRVGEARYYLLRYAPVPVRFEPDPRTVDPSPRGKVWLIVQNHGDAAFFPADELAAYERVIDLRLGPARSTALFELPRNETWSILEYAGV